MQALRGMNGPALRAERFRQLLGQSAALIREFFVNKQVFFARQLAAWLYQADWHYKTLLAIVIEYVDHLPKDGNALVNELLLHYPVKPTERKLTDFLNSSARVSNWFATNPVPTIKHLSLASERFTDHPTDHTKGKTTKRLPIIDTIGDLAEWLSLSLPELDWFANFWRFDTATPEHLKHYQYQLLEKQDGHIRLIEKPKTRLKQLQRKIYEEILATVKTHSAAHGFCPGRSCLSHASIHTNKRYVMSYDIEQCFQSIGWLQVKTVFLRMGYPAKVSTYLTALCTHSVQLNTRQLMNFDASQRARLRQRHIPQGAPGSPALTNIILYRLDQRLTGLANSLGLNYSRYADDIAMSGNAHRDYRFLQPLIGGICLDEGVTLNNRKTRITRSHQKQRLTGIVVNNKPNIDRKQFDVLKATLTNCARYGLQNQNRNNHPDFDAHLLGKIQYVKSINKQKGVKLERIYQSISLP